MQIKEIKPLPLFCRAVRTTLSGLTLQTGAAAGALYKEAIALGLDIAGPLHWQYISFDTRPESAFTLHIALPVAEEKNGYIGQYAFGRTDPFRCLSAVLEGAWQHLPLTYQKLFDYLAEQGLQPTSLNREVFLTVNFDEPEANATEVQIGIN